MLYRKFSPNGPVYYASPLLERAGVRHAFSTRIGGVSTGAFATLNFGNPAGAVRDPEKNLVENHRRLFAAIGCEAARLVRLHQVHGATLFDGQEAVRTSCKGDGILSNDPGLAISVRIADCVPVLMSDESGHTVAAVHAGWRGIVAGIVPKAVVSIRARSGQSPVLAAVGPCIGFDAFEVGPEVLEQFEALDTQTPLRRRSDGKGYVDLREAIRSQLIRAGVDTDAIDMTDRCSFRHADEFFSHRREQGFTGRMIAVIAARPTDAAPRRPRDV